MKINLYDQPNDKFKGLYHNWHIHEYINNASNEYEHDLAIISTTYERLFRQGYESLILGDLNGHM